MNRFTEYRDGIEALENHIEHLKIEHAKFAYEAGTRYAEALNKLAELEKSIVNYQIELQEERTYTQKLYNAMIQTGQAGAFIGEINGYKVYENLVVPPKGEV